MAADKAADIDGYIPADFNDGRSFVELLIEIVGAHRVIMFDVARMELAFDLQHTKYGCTRINWIRENGAKFMKTADDKLVAQVDEIIIKLDKLITKGTLNG